MEAENYALRKKQRNALTKLRLNYACEKKNEIAWLSAEEKLKEASLALD